MSADAGTIKKALLIAAGSVSLALGVTGIFLPVLPTTPFLLLSAYCYLRSSARLYNWLLNHRVFGPYVYNYITFKAVTRNVKIGTLVFLWLTLAISILFVPNIYVRISLLAVGFAVSIHVLTLKTMPKEDAGGSH